MSEKTQRLGLALIQVGQGQKELTHNEALHRLDRLVHLTVKSRTTATPPVNAAIGETWIVPSGAGGAWALNEARLAEWTGASWLLSDASEGMLCWIADEAIPAVFSAGGWLADFFPVGGLRVGSAQIFGAPVSDVASPAGGSIVDTEARAAINSLCTYLRLQGILGTL